MNWHRLTIEQVFELFGSKLTGLTNEAAEEKLLEYGLNQIKEGQKKSIAGIFISQFKDIMILILLAAAIVSGIIGDLSDTTVILIIVLLNALIGFFQEYHAEKAIQALKKMNVPYAKTIRNGEKITLSSLQVVPGDILILETGDAIPADLRLIECYNLILEEAALTGESQGIDKSTNTLEQDDLPLGDKRNMAFKGTFVTNGRGRGIVVATGMQTELGRIAKLLQDKESLTPLQQRMAAFGKKLSVLVLLLCIIFFTAGWLRGEDIIKMILTSISLAVASIPEALPAVITISLALAAKRMIKMKSLIRKLPAIETLGSVTYICTDKTGTLTKNKMSVIEIYIDEKRYTKEIFDQIKDSEKGKMLLEAFALNNDVIKVNDVIKGDATEVALWEASSYLSITASSLPRIAEIPFDANRKLMTTFHDYNGSIISFTKGAPDILLKKCTDTEHKDLQNVIHEMAGKGLRVIGFGYRYWEKLPDELMPELVENNLECLGFCGMMDPPREEVFQAVKECKQAGIVPVMITGDHPLTAENIAKQIGIISDKKDRMVSGQELSGMSDEKLNQHIENIKVYARVSPEQKLRIVKALQEKGHYVAMTGDGVNDAPSLKRANIGIAMGITGTDVSKEAAHMILLDDNFSTIIKAIKEGRRIYDNILKFIKYLMTTNAGELWTLLLGPLFGLPIALLPIHILWINLVSDGLPAICLSFEKAEKHIMHRPPRLPQETIFAKGRGGHMIWIGLLMAAIALSVQHYSIINSLHWQTIVFNVLCLSQLAHVMAIRSESQSLLSIGVFSNRPLIISVIFTLILQTSITYIPFFQPIFKTESLTTNEFIATGLLSSLVFIAVELEKFFRRKT